MTAIVIHTNINELSLIRELPAKTAISRERPWRPGAMGGGCIRGLDREL